MQFRNKEWSDWRIVVKLELHGDSHLHPRSPTCTALVLIFSLALLLIHRGAFLNKESVGWCPSSPSSPWPARCWSDTACPALSDISPHTRARWSTDRPLWSSAPAGSPSGAPPALRPGESAGGSATPGAPSRPEKLAPCSSLINWERGELPGNF